MNKPIYSARHHNVMIVVVLLVSYLSLKLTGHLNFSWTALCVQAFIVAVIWLAPEEIAALYRSRIQRAA